MDVHLDVYLEADFMTSYDIYVKTKASTFSKELKGVKVAKVLQNFRRN